MTFYLDTNLIHSILFADAHTTRAFNWLGKTPNGLIVGDWAAVELSALVHRRVRSGLRSSNDAQAEIADFDALCPARPRPYRSLSSAGAAAIDLARDAALKL